jgi:ABC-type sugar transport system substrate-binding protein
MMLLRNRKPFPAAIAMAMLVALLLILLAAPAASGQSNSVSISEIQGAGHPSMASSFRTRMVTAMTTHRTGCGCSWAISVMNARMSAMKSA